MPERDRRIEHPDLPLSKAETLHSAVADLKAMVKFSDEIRSVSKVEMLEETLRDTQYEGVTAHLKRALELLSDRKSPDYRNSSSCSPKPTQNLRSVGGRIPGA